jgi:hypothetical protein
MMFRVDGREYEGETAVEIVEALKRHALGANGRGLNLRDFLRWSYARLADRIPLRELDVADALDEETLALSYLYLRDEFGAGELKGAPLRGGRTRPDFSSRLSRTLTTKERPIT